MSFLHFRLSGETNCLFSTRPPGGATAAVRMPKKKMRRRREASDWLEQRSLADVTPRKSNCLSVFREVSSSNFLFCRQNPVSVVISGQTGLFRPTRGHFRSELGFFSFLCLIPPPHPAVLRLCQSAATMSCAFSQSRKSSSRMTVFVSNGHIYSHFNRSIHFLLINIKGNKHDAAEWDFLSRGGRECF